MVDLTVSVVSSRDIDILNGLSQGYQPCDLGVFILLEKEKKKDLKWDSTLRASHSLSGYRSVQ